MSTLSLSCDNFHENVANGLLWMLESEQLANVTIAVEGRYLKAHQLVLSICSPYFRSLLETNTCNHPIVFMKDVKYHIMQNLLRFMYEGQTQIEAEDFHTFVETAQALQIKWLMNIATKTEHKLDQHPHSSPTPSYAMKRKYKPRTPERNNAIAMTTTTAQVQKPFAKRAKTVSTSTESERNINGTTTVVVTSGLDHFFPNPVDTQTQNDDDQEFTKQLEPGICPQEATSDKSQKSDNLKDSNLNQTLDIANTAPLLKPRRGRPPNRKNKPTEKNSILDKTLDNTKTPQPKRGRPPKRINKPKERTSTLDKTLDNTNAALPVRRGRPPKRKN